jgi:hypothetical protein
MKSVLEELYKATGGTGWVFIHNWLSTNSIDTWFGIKLDENGEILEIDLRENNLAGIPYYSKYYNKTVTKSVSQVNCLQIYHNW